MKPTLLILLLAVGLPLPWQTVAQIYDTNNDVVQTFAGYGIPGYQDGQGQLSQFSSPSQVVSDTASNLYVWDGGNHLIRKITPDATVTTLAGGGVLYEGYGTNASLAWGTAGALAIDHSNTLWLVMVNGYYGGVAYLLTIGTNGYVSIQNGGLTNLGTLSGVGFDSANRLYYTGGNRVYRYASSGGSVEAVAGAGVAGNADGQGPVYSTFNSPQALACDPADNLYVWDAGNGTIRRIDPALNVTTVAGKGYYSMADGVGTNAALGSIASMFFDNAGNLYLVSGSCVRRMDAQTNVVTLAGNFDQYSPGYANGPGYLARFSNASGGCFSQGMVFVADTGNHRIRNIAFNPSPQVLPAASLQLNLYPGLLISGVIGRTYEIQSSPDMSAWTTTATLLLSSSPHFWVDQKPVAGTKYYRAVLLP